MKNNSINNRISESDGQFDFFDGVFGVRGKKDSNTNTEFPSIPGMGQVSLVDEIASFLSKEELKPEVLTKKNQNLSNNKAPRHGLPWGAVEKDLLKKAVSKHPWMLKKIVGDQQFCRDEQEIICSISSQFSRSPSSVIYTTATGFDDKYKFNKVLKKNASETDAIHTSSRFLASSVVVSDDDRNLWQMPFIEFVNEKISSGDRFHGRVTTDAGSGKSRSSQLIISNFIENEAIDPSQPKIFVNIFPTNKNVKDGFLDGLHHYNRMDAKNTDNTIIMKLIGAHHYTDEDIDCLIGILDETLGGISISMDLQKDFKNVKNFLGRYKNNKQNRNGKAPEIDLEPQSSPELQVFKILKTLKTNPNHSSHYKLMEGLIMRLSPSVFMHGNQEFINSVFKGKKLVVYTNAHSYFLRRGAGSILGAKLSAYSVAGIVDEVHKVWLIFVSLSRDNFDYNDYKSQNIIRPLMRHLSTFEKNGHLTSEIGDKINDIPNRKVFKDLISRVNSESFPEAAEECIKTILKNALENPVILNQVKVNKVSQAGYTSKIPGSVNAISHFDLLDPKNSNTKKQPNDFDKVYVLDNKDNIKSLVDRSDINSGTSYCSQEDNRHYTEILMSVSSNINNWCSLWMVEKSRLGASDWLGKEKLDDEINRISDEICESLLGSEWVGSGLGGLFGDISRISLNFSEEVEAYDDRHIYSGCETANLPKKTNFRELLPRVLISMSGSIFKDPLGNLPVFTNSELPVVDMLKEIKTIRDGWRAYCDTTAKKHKKVMGKSRIYSFDGSPGKGVLDYEVIDSGVDDLVSSKSMKDKIGLVVVNSKQAVKDTKEYIDKSYPGVATYMEWDKGNLSESSINANIKKLIKSKDSGDSNWCGIVIIYRQIVEGVNFKFQLNGSIHDIPVLMLPYDLSHLSIDVMTVIAHLDKDNLDSDFKKLAEAAYKNDKKGNNTDSHLVKAALDRYLVRSCGMTADDSAKIIAREGVVQIIGRIFRGAFKGKKRIYCTEQWVDNIEYHVAQSKSEGLRSPTIDFLEAMLLNRGSNTNKVGRFDWGLWYNGGLEALNKTIDSSGPMDVVDFFSFRDHAGKSFSKLINEFFSYIVNTNPEVDIEKAIDGFDEVMDNNDQTPIDRFIAIWDLIRDIVCNGKGIISQLDSNSTLVDIFSCFHIFFDKKELDYHIKGNSGEAEFRKIFKEKHMGNLLDNAEFARLTNDHYSWEVADFFIIDAERKEIQLIDVKNQIVDSVQVGVARKDELIGRVKMKMGKISHILNLDEFLDYDAKFIFAIKSSRFSYSGAVSLSPNLEVDFLNFKEQV